MRFSFASNGDYCSMILIPDSTAEQHLLDAFRSSTLPHFSVERTNDGLKVSRRAVPPPNEETGNTL